MTDSSNQARTTSRWIWPFELMDKLGEGGMGVVYRARYVGNDRIVAVKLLPDEVASNPTLVARFDRELEILTQLRHKNIVHCFGGTTESKQRFYAMELVEGGTLAEALQKKKRLSWDHVVDYGMQMCSALEYAHERGVIHRDVKPANFLLTKAGKLKLSDFGLATIVAGQRITMQGKTAGTFLYMAPEQIRGKPPVSNRTDLYALGCVFFELLTGQPPFDAQTPAEVLHKHLKETPPRVSSIILDCPQELERLISDLLQKDPALRPASAAEVEYRLASILRPSLVQHVDMMARTPSADVAPVMAAPSDDEVEIPEVPRGPAPALVRNLLAAVAVLSILTGWGWWSAWTAGARARQYAELWANAASTSGPLQVPALQQMAAFPELTSRQVTMLFEIVASETQPEVRIAAVQALARHPAEAHPEIARLINLERTEAETSVRTEVAQARQTIEAFQPGGGGVLWTLARWLIFLAILGGGGWAAWNYGVKRLIDS